MTTTTTHDLARIANNPTAPVRTAVYVGPDGDYIEQWIVPMTGVYLYTRVYPRTATRDDAWGMWVSNPDELLTQPAAVMEPSPIQVRALHAMLFEMGWRVEKRTPYTGPIGQMEWNAHNAR